MIKEITIWAVFILVLSFLLEIVVRLLNTPSSIGVFVGVWVFALIVWMAFLFVKWRF